MKKALITIGGEEREISELPMGKSRAWRKKFEGPFSEILDAIGQAQNIEISNTKDLSKIVTQFKGLLLDSVDTVSELVIEYAQLDAEWVEENAYTSELMEAFTVVLGMAFPVDFLARAMGKIGASPSPILTNGASPTTEDTPTTSET